MGGGLIMSVLTAHYLGPSDFGLLNYAIAFSTFFHVVTNVGFDATLVKELLQNPQRSHLTIGTAIGLRFFVAIAMLGLSLISSSIFDPGRHQVLLMVGVLGTAFIVQSAETIEYWYQSRQAIHKSAFARLSAFMISAIFRLWLIFSGKPMVWFSASLFVEAIFSSFFFLVSFKRNEKQSAVFRFKPELARNLVMQGIPMIFSTMIWYVYSRLDQVMIGHYLGDEPIGYFSVSTRITEVFIFIPSALSASMLPVLVGLLKDTENQFLSKVQSLFDIVFLIGVSICFVLFFGAPWFIEYTFGKSFLPASAALSVQGFVCLFSSMGVAIQQVFIARNQSRILLFRNLAGAIMNLTLNIFWIPLYGIIGACFATVLSTFCVNVMANLIIKEARPLFKMQCIAFLHLFDGTSFRLIFSKLSIISRSLKI